MAKLWQSAGIKTHVTGVRCGKICWSNAVSAGVGKIYIFFGSALAADRSFCQGIY
ncbi:hypothetical protein [Candidatus Endoriftia persephone]|jgi:hypothetical protein|uniref:Uncharacterized protein n=1 Tax=Candidatus Endoriftia persephonae TaxID=393765 RepID=A0A9J6ZV66_9GAMM|nr:hypothetical protein [Candidatus Endoriftia persephone]USF86597.1 hypothetical protein L0Y14_10660 [Candidatus Endoriftia persephone]